jgi:sugar phosphate permease
MKKIYYGWIIVSTLFIINFATQAAGTLNLGLFILPMCTDMGFSRSLFGWLTTFRALAGGISSFFLGPLLDKFGPRVMIPVSSLMTGFCLIGIGTAKEVRHLFIFFAIIGLAGLINAGGGLLTSVPVAKWFIKKRGLTLALTSLGMGIGSITFIPITQLFISGYGWRNTWIIFGILNMALTIPVALIFLRRQPEDMGLLPDGDSEAAVKAEKEDSSYDPEIIWTVREAIHTRSFWLITLSLLLGSLATGASVHRIPYWIELGFDPKLVSICFAVDAAGAAIMMLAAGLILDRFPPRFVTACAYGGFIIAVILMLIGSNAVIMFLSGIIYGSAVGTLMICQTYLWAKYYGRSFLGGIRGITLPAVLLGVAIGAPAVGYIYDFTGSYRPGWQAVMVLYLLALIIILLATPPKHKT